MRDKKTDLGEVQIASPEKWSCLVTNSWRFRNTIELHKRALLIRFELCKYTDRSAKRRPDLRRSIDDCLCQWENRNASESRRRSSIRWRHRDGVYISHAFPPSNKKLGCAKSSEPTQTNYYLCSRLKSWIVLLFTPTSCIKCSRLLWLDLPSLSCHQP